MKPPTSTHISGFYHTIWHLPVGLGDSPDDVPRLLMQLKRSVNHLSSATSDTILVKEKDLMKKNALFLCLLWYTVNHCNNFVHTTTLHYCYSLIAILQTIEAGPRELCSSYTIIIHYYHTLLSCTINIQYWYTQILVFVFFTSTL